jgi:hypothetical protein
MQFDFLFDLGVSALLTTLRSVIKNPKSKEQYKKVMFKIYTQIKLAFPEFENEEN